MLDTWTVDAYWPLVKHFVTEGILMIKLTIFVVRKSDLSFDEFDTYWKTKHREVIEQTHEFNRHIRRYTQCHAVHSDAIFGEKSKYDGIAELWFDDVEKMNEAFNEPKYTEIVRPDELLFVAVDKCLSFVSEELHVL